MRRRETRKERIKREKNSGFKKGLIASLLLTTMMMPTVASAESFKTTEHLNLRTGPSISHERLLTIPQNTRIENIESDGDWYSVEYDGNNGYVSGKYVERVEPSIINNTLSWVTKSVPTDDLNMRVGPSNDYGVMLVIPKGAEVDIIDNSNQWYQVNYGNNEGFVNSDYIEEVEILDAEIEGVNISKGEEVTPAREHLVDTALELVGKVPYFWGGKSEKTGWNEEWNKPKKITSAGSRNTGKIMPYGLDCSGFVDWAYRSADLGDVFSKGGTASQWENSFPIARESLLIGDVAFKQDPKTKSVNHIGIYVGKDVDGEEMFVHASSGKNNVVVTNARGGAFKHFRRAKNTF